MHCCHPLLLCALSMCVATYIKRVGFTALLGMCAPGQPEYEHAARRSLYRLWSMRTPLGLFGTSLDMTTASWLSSQGGIGASADSFYEYLLKAYVLFGRRFLTACLAACFLPKPCAGLRPAPRLCSRRRSCPLGSEVC